MCKYRVCERRVYSPWMKTTEHDTIPLNLPNHKSHVVLTAQISAETKTHRQATGERVRQFASVQMVSDKRVSSS